MDRTNYKRLLKAAINILEKGIALENMLKSVGVNMDSKTPLTETLLQIQAEADNIVAIIVDGLHGKTRKCEFENLKSQLSEILISCADMDDIEKEAIKEMLEAAIIDGSEEAYEKLCGQFNLF